MTTKEVKNMLRFKAALGIKNDNLLWELRRLSGILNRLNLLACNERELNQAEKDHEKSTEEKVRTIAKMIHCKVEFDGDPRGYPFRFVTKSGGGNSLAGGWGIDF